MGSADRSREEQCAPLMFPPSSAAACMSFSGGYYALALWCGFMRVSNRLTHDRCLSSAISNSVCCCCNVLVSSAMCLFFSASSDLRNSIIAWVSSLGSVSSRNCAEAMRQALPTFSAWIVRALMRCLTARSLMSRCSAASLTDRYFLSIRNITE